MRRTVGAAAALLSSGAIVVSLCQPAAAMRRPEPGGSSVTALTAANSAQLEAPRTGPNAPWSREEVGYGAQDLSPYSIEHVRELQYRLKWVGVFPGTASGYYGSATREAVKAFQARRHIVVSGRATTLTWRLLLRQTVRHPAAIPAVCKGAGWHACYDRSMHQVTLWSDGAMYNTWLVRGGGYTTQTRVGTHRVYFRDIDHISGLYSSPMPYSQFFDGGEALHGSRLMMSPFVDHSHGCVNMYAEDARQLWSLTHASPLWVTVYGAWS